MAQGCPGRNPNRATLEEFTNYVCSETHSTNTAQTANAVSPFCLPDHWPFRIFGAPLVSAGTLWPRVPSPACNVRGQSGGPLCRDRRLPRGGRVLPFRETQQLFGGNPEA